MYKYIDITRINTTNTKEEARINNALDGTVDLSNYNNMSLVKLDLNVSNLRLFRPVLRQPQQFISGKQNNGYFETIYKIKLSFYDSNDELKEYETPIYFYNNELTYSEYTVESREDTDNPGYYYYNNFNKYFNIYTLENFNMNVVRTIKELVIDNGFIASGSDLLTVIPTINTINNIIYIYITETSAATTTTIRYYNTREEVVRDGTIGAYTVGFNAPLKNIYYRPFQTKLYSDYYYLNNNPIKTNLMKVEIGNDKYYIAELQNTQYLEYISDVSSVLITTSIKINEIIINKRNQDFILYDSVNNDLISSGDNIFSRLQLINETEKVFRVTYNNEDITNNTLKLISKNNISTIGTNIYILDKYGNQELLELDPLDSIYIQICIF